MQWEVWAIPTANMIAAERTEADALAVVRNLLATDWSPDELTVIVADDAVPVDELPPGVTGDELARRLRYRLRPAVRRTA
jgi:hypothetical protein